MTPDGWEEVAATVTQRKAALGIPATILPLSAVGSWPDAEDIRDAIRQQHAQSPVSHVWLLGDEWLIPPFLGLQQTIHDFGYSLADDSDYLPDWVVGRLPMKTPADALAWLRKQQQFQQQHLAPPQAMVSASSLHYDDVQGRQVADSLLSYGLHTTLLQQSAGTNNGDRILTTLEEGLQWLVYFGHGDAVGFNSLQPGIQADDIGQMTLPVPTMVTSAACDVANFTLPNGNSMGEAFVAGGGVAFVGCTGPCHYDYSDTMAKHLLFAYLQHPQMTIGDAFLAAQQQLIRSFPDNYLQLTELTLQQFVLLGDPTALPPVAPSTSLILDSSATAYHWLWPAGEWTHIGLQHGDQQIGYYSDAGSFSLDRQTLHTATTVAFMGRHIPFAAFQLPPSTGNPVLSPNPVLAGNSTSWSGGRVFTYRITNVMGQVWHGQSSDGTIKWLNQPAGVYMYEVTGSDNRCYQGKVVVLRP